ncbi:MAG: response regulator [Candidatus Omnitrophica bacterium]|nr:response regulator [Candidatus Omnitrophota bacterium]
MKKGYSVLIVDDEEDLRDMMTFQFKARGFEVFTASNGIEGLERLKTISPSLIILDINMPRMGGIEMYERLCDAEGNPSHPVLILTARANTEQLFKRLAIDGFMSKPFEVDELINEAEIIVRKYDREAPKKKSRPQLLETIYIANDDADESNAIALALLHSGYRVALASTGASALEILATAPPQLALVKLGLADIPGDVLVLRALHMAKTSDIKFVLFENRDPRHVEIVRRRLSEKSGVLGIIEYAKTEELVEAVAKVIEKGRMDDQQDYESFQRHYVKFVKNPYLSP